MKNFILFFLFLYLGFTSFTFAKKIDKILVNGNKRISKETILVLGNIKLGNEINETQLNQILKNLYDTDFFKDINFKFEKNILTIDLIENPIISNIEIEGIKNKQLLKLITDNMILKDRMSFVNYSYSQDVNTIENILRSNGYYFSKVTSNYILDEKLNSVDIKINIALGDKAKIKNIVFLGDKKIKDRNLLSIISSEEHKFWKFLSNRVYLDKSRVELDTRLLLNYYRNLGFYNANVNNSFVEITNKNDFNLIFKIESGKKFFFDQFFLNIPDDYDKNDFNKIFEIFEKIKDKEYSLNEINNILELIENIAAIKQYEFISAEVTENVINDKISFTFDIKNSDIFYVERINILGNFNTYEEVIRNKLLVDEGDPFNEILFNKSLDNIRSTGFFKKVTSNIENSNVSPGLKTIDIVVEEQPTGEISLGAGYGTSGSTIAGGINEKNFLGKGINLVSNLELSENSLKGEFNYIRPNFNYSDNTLNTSIKSITSDFLGDYGYKISTLSTSIGTKFEQFENIFFAPEIELSLDNLETNSKASGNLKKQEGSYEDLYFNYLLNMDRRNSNFNPSSGNNSTFIQNLPIISGNNEISNTFIFNQYMPLNQSKSMIGKGGFYFKAVNTINDNDVRVSKRTQIPYSKLRGFEKGKIGPKDNNEYVGGNYAASLNLSSNIPFLLSTMENLEFNYFIDVANVWGVDYDDSIDDSSMIRSSTGIGLNFLTPIGPLSFSLAQPITKKSSDKTETFRFNLGTTF